MTLGINHRYDVPHFGTVTLWQNGLMTAGEKNMTGKVLTPALRHTLTNLTHKPGKTLRFPIEDRYVEPPSTHHVPGDSPDDYVYFDPDDDGPMIA